MKVRYSPKKNIPIVEFGNDIEANMTNDDPVRWIMVSMKKRGASGQMETVRQMLEPRLFKTSLKREIKKNMNRDELEKFSKLLKQYIKKGVLTKDSMMEMVKKI